MKWLKFPTKTQSYKAMNIKFLTIISISIVFAACGEPKQKTPDNIYITWAAHDQLSDTVKLTEELADKELNAFLSLRSEGVKLDYFLLDMFWFSKHTLYTSFNEDWKNGHQAFFKKAKDNHVKLGLWLSANVLGWNENMRWLYYHDTLGSSICKDKYWLTLYQGNWSNYFNSILEYWYGQGVTLFKIDFANFNAVKEGDEGKYTKEQIVEMNKQAFYHILESFKKKHPDCKFIAYNGFFDPDHSNKKETDWWLNVFDGLFCGDPQPGLVPCFNFNQSIALFSDQKFRTFAGNEIPVSRIDNSQFMLSNTGTGFYRGKKDWKTMLVSTLAKRSMVQTYYGNIDLLNTDDARWMAKAQNLFYEMDTLLLAGEYPYQAKPYSYHLKNKKGGLLFIVNPSQEFRNIKLPEEYDGKPSFVLFSQKGYQNLISNNSVSLAPEQSVLIGFQNYADKQFSLGEVDEGSFPDRQIPIEIRNRKVLPKSLSFTVSKPEKGNIRLVFQFYDSTNNPVKINGGSPPYGKYMDNILKISAVTGKQSFPVKVNYNLQIWAGLAWAVVEIEEKNLPASTENIEVKLEISDEKFYGKIIESCYNAVYK
jgi:hypothetical protein